MKRSNSTSMITELLSGIERNRYPRRRNSIGPGLKGKRLLSASNVSLPILDTSANSSSTPLWASPVKHHQPLSSPLPFSRISSPTSRVVQLRKEESIDARLREVEQDREVTSQIQLNQSWSELKLEDDDMIRPEMMDTGTLPCPVAMTTGIQFNSPSSPILSSRMRSRSLTPTSPSSTRSFTYRRSLSPAPLRPSSLVFQPQRKRQRPSDQNEEMDISPTQLHPPAKRAVFQSPLSVPSCTSPLLTTQHVNINNDDDITNNTRPAFDTTTIQSYNSHTYNHPHLSYDHTPLSCLSSKPADYSTNHTHQCIESAFLPFKTANGLTQPIPTSNLTPPASTLSPPTSNMSPNNLLPSDQLEIDEAHFEQLTNSLNPVTTIS